MRVDKGIAALVYRKNQNRKEYLILKRDKNWSGWEIPKGHLEHDSHMATVFLELNEEAGIEPVNVKKVLPLTRNLTFSFEEDGEEVISDFRCFEVEVEEDAEVDLSRNPSDEHSDYEWLPRLVAKDRLEYEEQRNLL